MNDLITTTQNTGLITFLHRNNNMPVIPKPFERDIFLLDTYVAGTTHVVGIDDLEPYLNVGDKLNFFREPDNAYDSLAILIKNSDGVKIGYVPRKDNAVLARLLDAGKLIFGRITDKEWQGDWLKIEIKIYLHE